MRGRVPPSARLSVAGVTRHAKNAPVDWRGVGDSDFAPGKRGRVELGASTTGSASFAIGERSSDKNMMNFVLEMMNLVF